MKEIKYFVLSACDFIVYRLMPFIFDEKVYKPLKSFISLRMAHDMLYFIIKNPK